LTEKVYAVYGTPMRGQKHWPPKGTAFLEEAPEENNVYQR